MLYKRNELGDLVIDAEKAKRFQRANFPELYRTLESQRTGIPRDYVQEFKEDLLESVVGIGLVATMVTGAVAAKYVIDVVAPYLQ